MMRERRYDVDWLRVLTMVVVFYFHNAKFFEQDGWHIQNDELSFGLTVFTNFAAAWMMPLFFMLSGMATRYSLTLRSAGQYLRERVQRLLVPLVFGVLVIIPPQVYCERVFESQFRGSYWQFYPQFFRGIYPGGNFSWHHLWFLAYLFVFSLIALPLFVALRQERGQHLIARLGAFCRRPGALFLLAVPIVVIEVTLRPLYLGLQTLISDWANFLSYLTLFLYGYLLAADAAFQAALDRQWRPALAAAVATTGVLAFILIRYDIEAAYTPAFAATTTLRVFASWFWLIVFLGAGRRYLSFSNRFLRYANEIVLPFYVWHQTVIIVIGFYVLRWHAGVAQKYLTISTCALALTLLLCEFAVRRSNVTRFLFGMRLRTRTASSAA